MSARLVGNGMYEVKLAGDPHTYSVMVLGEHPYCTCAFFREREIAAAKEPDELKKPTVSCPHLQVAGQEHNDVTRRSRQQPGYYRELEQQHGYENAKDDLIHMLEELHDGPGESR